MTGAPLPDIQDSHDDRGIDIDEVGVADVRVPVRFVDGHTEHTGIATFAVTVALPAQRRGTHMSRMVELIEDAASRFDPRELPRVLKEAQVLLQADSVHIDASFPMAMRVKAPVSGKAAHQIYETAFRASATVDSTVVKTTVTAEVTSLCPCSKAISDYGAHNQRSSVSVSVLGQAEDFYPIDARSIAELIRQSGSCPVYPLVKRPDERFITMAAFDHPVFVEDIVRDLGLVLRARGVSHEISASNLESIHSHNAVATLRWTPELA